MQKFGSLPLSFPKSPLMMGDSLSKIPVSHVGQQILGCESSIERSRVVPDRGAPTTKIGRSDKLIDSTPFSDSLLYRGGV
jgi:hypothetical protein